MLINKYDVTEKMYIEWTYESKKEGKRLFFCVFWSVLFLSCLILFGMYSQEYLLLVFGIYCIYRSFVRDYVVAKAFYKKTLLIHKDNKWSRVIRIEDDCIVIDDGNALVEYNTSNIIRTVQNDKRIRVFMNDGNSIRMYKNAFVEGNIEDYKDVLKLKC